MVYRKIDPFAFFCSQMLRWEGVLKGCFVWFRSVMHFLFWFAPLPRKFFSYDALQRRIHKQAGHSLRGEAAGCVEIELEVKL